MSAFDMVRSSLSQLSLDELRAIEKEIYNRLKNNIEIDTEYLEYAEREGDNSISIDQVRERLSSCKVSFSQTVIDSREERI